MEGRSIIMVAVLATAVILLGSLALSQYVSDTQASIVSNGLDSLQGTLQQLQMITYVGNSNSTLSCALLSSNLPVISNQLARLGSDVQSADLENKTGGQYAQLVIQLNYARLEYWLFVQRVNKQCGEKWTTLLMFYAPLNCDSCVLEGEQLTYITQTYPNISYTVLDGSLNMSAIDTLKSIYNLSVSDYPALVINGQDVVKGYQDTAQTLGYMCRYTNISSFCQVNGTTA